MKKKNNINQKNTEVNQVFNIKGLFPPQNLKVTFQPSPKQYEMWRCLEPNSCNLCGGEIGRKESVGSSGLPTFNPVCKKCGNENIPQLVLGGGSGGGGKMCLKDSLVCTPYGFKMLGELGVGDFISSPTTGGKQQIIQKHPEGTHEFYRITFEDGTHVDCSEGHLWEAWKTGGDDITYNKHGEFMYSKVYETKVMYEFMENKKKGEYKRSNLTIPVTAPVEFYNYGNPDKRPIPPYALGVLLGDGCFAESIMCKTKPPRLTSMDKHIIERLREVGCTVEFRCQKTNSKAKEYTVDCPNMYESIVKFGLYGTLSDTKFIPDAYKMAPIKDRFEILRGLIDTDAEVSKTGKVIYTTVSKQLADDVAFIVRSLGGIANIRFNDNAGYKDDDNNFVRCKDAYNIRITFQDKSQIMTLPRKLSRLVKGGYNGGVSVLSKRIESIEPIGKHTSFCITVNEPRGLYITNNFTVTHNSYVGCTWIAMSCIQFAGIRAVIARKTLKSLTGSTWKTLLDILDKWGLVDGINYKTNEKDGTLLFWNGSSIVKQELELLPRDPVYQRLGSSEFTIGFVDETGEIAEKGVEVLYSRLRYKVNETFKVPKMLLTTNPVPNWVRDRFVQDKNGEAVKTRMHEVFIPFTVFDNPDKEFVQVYATSLSNMRDEKEKQRLLYGNWDFMDTKDTVIYKEFDGEKHLITNLFDKKYDPLKPLTFVWDFNVIPQMSVFMAQIDYQKKEIYIFKEFSGTPKEKNNSTPAMARELAGYMRTLGHAGGYNITGDPSGLQRSTATEIGINNYTIINDAIVNQGLRATRMLLPKTPPQKTRCEFVNMVFTGELGWNIYIDLSCRLLTADMMFQEQNPDGTKSKKKVTDPETGSKYEKYGHFSDNLDYFIVLFLRELFSRYTSGGLHSSSDSNAYNKQIVSSAPRPKFNF